MTQMNISTRLASAGIATLLVIADRATRAARPARQRPAAAPAGRDDIQRFFIETAAFRSALRRPARRRIEGRARRYSTLAAAAALAALTSAPSASAFTTLDPGGPPRLTETVPVQVLFVGYERDLVPEAGMLAALPQRSKPTIWSRRAFGSPEDVGLDYRYDNRVVYADQAYEDGFFAELTRRSRPLREVNVNRREVTCHQQAYNEQQRNVVDIPTSYVIDAVSVERWLVEHPAAGIDPRRNTVVFINWWGRRDFRFHVYTKFGEPDVDTGSENGRYCGQMTIAGGGTGANDEETGFGRDSRLWFHDLSAGPDWRTGNYNVDDADIDGDGTTDYRLPPVWEYLTPGGVRERGELAGDLQRVARYVAVDALFTASPLYPPYLTPDAFAEDVELDMQIYEGLPGVNATRDLFNAPLIRQEVSELLRAPLKASLQAKQYKDEARRCYRLFVLAVSCHPERDSGTYGTHGESNLFLQHALSQSSWRDGSADYEAALFGYVTNDHFAYPGFSGYADDNWIDGTQSGVFVVIHPSALQNGFGPSQTSVHEYGHHFGLRHPFHSYDWEQNRDLGPLRNHFMWVGSEVNSVMSYQKTNYDFSQFDIDNANRFRAAAYLRSANLIAARVLANPGAAAGADELTEADARFADAQAALSSHDYPALFDNARAGYNAVMAAAHAARVPVIRLDSGWDVLAPEHGAGPSHKHDYDSAAIDRGSAWQLDTSE
jgi:hypothetical protein